MEHIGSGACLTMICSDICEISNKTELCRPTPLPTPTPTPPVPTCPEWEVAVRILIYLAHQNILFMLYS